MELPSAKTALIPAPWLRVLIFVLAYLGTNVFAYRFILDDTSLINTLEEQVSGFSGSSDKEYNILMITLLISFLIGVALVVVFRKFIDRQTVSSLGFEYRKHIPDAVVGCLLPVIILGTVSLILFFSNSLTWTDISFSSGDFLNGLFLMVVIAVGEEMVFRGYILNNLMQSLHKWLALTISAALFALMHSNNTSVDIVAMVNLFASGLLLGVNYIFTRNLWFSIFLHLLWNFVQGPVLGFPVSGVSLKSILHPEITGHVLLTGGGFGLEASMLTGIFLIITIVILFLIYRRKQTLDKPTTV